MAFQYGCVVDRLHRLDELFLSSKVLIEIHVRHICCKKKKKETCIIHIYLNL